MDQKTTHNHKQAHSNSPLASGPAGGIFSLFRQDRATRGRDLSGRVGIRQMGSPANPGLSFFTSINNSLRYRFAIRRALIAAVGRLDTVTQKVRFLWGRISVFTKLNGGVDGAERPTSQSEKTNGTAFVRAARVSRHSIELRRDTMLALSLKAGTKKRSLALVTQRPKKRSLWPQGKKSK